jgi:predicted transcriptional regulator
MVLYARQQKMTVKQQVQRIIDELPDECTVEDLQYQLYVIEKIRKGLKSVDEGRGIPHEQVKERLASWRKE